MSSLKNMFAPIEDFEEGKEIHDEEEYDDEDDAGWEDRWERMQESAAIEKRKIKTLKRLKASGEY